MARVGLGCGIDLKNRSISILHNSMEELAALGTTIRELGVVEAEKLRARGGSEQ
jgi:hypothetical protein